MHRHLGHRPGRAALIVVAALALIVTVAFAKHGPRLIKRSLPVLAARTAAPTNTTPAAATTASTPDSKPASSTSSTKAATPATHANAQPLPARAAGMVVGIDPETGRLGMPSAADRAALQRSGALASPSIDRSDVGLQVIHKPDGSKMIDLQGRFQEYAIVKIGPDGKKTQTCVQGQEVDAALKNDAAPPNGTAEAAPAAPAANEPPPATDR